MSCASPTITRLLMVIIFQLVFIFIWFDLIVLAASTINKSSPLSSPSSSPSTSPLTSSLSSSEPSSLSSASSRSSSSPTFSVRCPLPHLIQPCDCVEIEKGGDTEFNEVQSLGLTNDTVTNDTEGGDELSGDEINANINSEPHPDIIETVVFCKHIYSRDQLMESMKAFKGHRINYLVLDSCSIPPFPTNIFNQINILWMEVLNSTVQFRETFFECGAACL